MSLTLAEARARAAVISDVHTTVHLDLTSSECFAVRATVRFTSTTPGASSFLELAGASDVRVTGMAGASYADGRITLPRLEATNEVTVTAVLAYVSDGDGMHAFTDPTDGERYVSAYTSMDVTQKVLPCFDQPDLKTTFEVSATAPAHWTVLANGRLERRDGDTWHFARTPAISSYLFFITAGPWTSITWDQPYGESTLPFGWHARASQRALLERDGDELRRITEACFAHYTSTFDEPYAFDQYQQVFSPGLNWGAMEFPGCVSFRDEMLTPGEPTALEMHWRSSVIAHEMAHMWFGNLVTMRWWEDSWLNESFADFMGYEVAGTATCADSWTAAALQRKPTAFWADRRRSTHPVAEDADNLVDVDTAFANFDMITYAKGNALLRQLVTWLGPDDFLRGVNAHLSAHPFGNADLADFLAALDAATDRDVRTWAELWLRTTGYDRIEVSRDGDVPVLHRVGTRPHRFTVAAFDTNLSEVGARLVDLGDAPVRLEEFAGLAVVPNALDETYAEVVLDDESWSCLAGGISRVSRPLTRATLWRIAADRCERGLSDLEELLGVAVRQLVDEVDPTVFEGALSLITRLVRRMADSERAPIAARALATLGHAALTHGDEPRRASASRLLATTSDDADLLRSWLAGTAPLPEADQATRWLVVARLASLGDTSPIDPEAASDPSAVGALAVLTARAAESSAVAKQAAWELLCGGTLSNREVAAVASGLWSGDVDLVQTYVLAAPAALIDLARRSGQGMGKVLGQAFGWMPMPAALRAQLRDELAAALSGDDVPTVIGRALGDVLDDLDQIIAATRGGL